MISFIRHSVIYFGLILAAVLQWGSAQSYTWKNVEIGGGGFVTGTVFHPTEPGLVYARTDVGGIYRLDNTTKRWIPLNDDIGGINNEFQHLGVLTIGLDPSDANRVYIATGQYGGAESWKLPSRIYRSTNRGTTWSHTTTNFKMAGNGESRGTGERMAVDPLNGQNILVGTSDAGIWRSADYGATWTRMTNFTPASTNFLVYAPANHVNPGPNRRVYAAANTTTAQSFWFSDNNGSTWAEVPKHPGSTAGSEMMPIQGTFDAVGVFYSTWGNATGPSNGSSRYGVFKLTANGSSWTAILPPTGQGSFSGISADPRVAGHVVVSTLHRWWPGDEIYRSTDGGTTWTEALQSGTRSAGNSPWSSGPGAHWITDIDIDPFNSNRAVFNTGFGLIQTTNLSTSGAARLWTFFNDGLEELVPHGLLSPTAGPPLISVVADYTGFRHDHLDRSPLRGMHNPASGSTNIIDGADLAPAKVIRQNSGATLFSQDAAATWATFPTTPAPVVNGHNRVILSTDGQRLLWCPPNAPAYFSTDSGAHWTISANSLSLTNSNNTQTVAALAGAADVADATNGNGGNARFNNPTAIALDSAGVRYVADTANHIIRKIAAGGGVSTFAGGAGVPGTTNATGGNARFKLPAGLTVDASKNVYVADTGNHTIRKITAAGVVTTHAGGAGLTGSTNGTGTAARFSSPAGLVADASGNVFVCDTGNHIIRKITSAGVVTTVAGSPGVAGTTNANGGSARFNSPNGIALDTGGNLYVADSGNHTIRKIATNGDVSTFAGLSGTSGSTDASGGSARFKTPKAITIDASGTFHVADSGNHTIRKITSAGAVTTVAGLAGSSGNANGAGTTARFNNPSGIAATPDGFNIYVADTSSHTIRRNTLYNTLTPIADRVDGMRFYLWDSAGKRIMTSNDGGANFTVAATGVNAAFNQFRTVPGKMGHIWAKAGGSGIYQSSNFGATFTKHAAVAEVHQFDFGKAKPGASYPAVFIWGKVGSITGFFRSDDSGATWVRINDNLHNFGYQNDIAGDPRVYGRVYLGTSGRGVIYGDLPNPPEPPPQSLQIIYDDALQTAWANASGSGTSLVSFDPVYRGSSAISVAAGAGNGVSFNCSSRSLQGLSILGFWLHAGAGAPPSLQIGISRGGISLEAVPITVPATVGWQRVAIPLSSIGLANIDDLTGLRIEGRVVGGIAPGAFSLDDITLVIRAPTDVTDWVSNISGKVSDTATSSPLLNPNSSADTYSTNTLQSNFTPITLANPGDKITLTGNFQLTLAGISNQGNWFRFGLFDNRGQPPNIITAWSGYAGMGTSLQERITAGSGPFSSGSDATPRTPDASPNPVSANSPSGRPPVIFEETITRTTTGVILTFLIKRTDTNVVLMNYTYTDSSPNNNGVLTGANNTPSAGYNPTYNTAGFAFGKSYIATTGAQAQFSNIQVSFVSGITADSQYITFTAPASRSVTSAPFVLSANASSGLPVTFSLVSGPATLVGSTLTVNGIGTVVVRASQAGDLAYLPAADVDRSFTVTKAPATVTLGSLNPTYNGSPKSATATTNPSGKAVDFTYNGSTTAPTDAGSYSVIGTINDELYQGSASAMLVILAARSALENWRFENFESYADSGNAANPADPDSDGIVNLMEFALGLNPRHPSSLPATLVINGKQLEYTYTRSKAALATVSIVVERSDSLLVDDWITEDITEIDPPLADNGVLQTVKVVLPAGKGRRFVRLQVIDPS